MNISYQVVRILESVNEIALGYFIAINVIYLILITISFFYIRWQLKQKEVYSLKGLFSSNLYNPISILAPAFNEEATVVASVKSLLQLQFPNYEVIVINDGSKDRTMDVLIQHYNLKKVNRFVPPILKHKPIKAIYLSDDYPELIVVDKENGRKADALNAGINVSRNDLVCAIDADSVLEPLVLQSMLRSFIEDENTIAVGGIIRIANDCIFENNELKEVRLPKSFLARIQVVEYLRAFLFGRVGWDYLDSLLIISGAFGIFDRNAVLKVGGYLHDTVGEDMELVVRLHRYHIENNIPYKVRFLPEPVCWTEVPEDRKVLSRQRNRWQRGLADTLWRHKKMLFNPRYGRLGMFAMPFFFFFEMLGPLVEIGGLLFFVLSLALGLLNWQFALAFLTAAILLGIILSVSSVLCEEFTFRRYPLLKHAMIMIGYAFLENFGYRQMHSWWRLTGLWDFIKGNKEWGVMSRKGLGTNQPAIQIPYVTQINALNADDSVYFPNVVDLNINEITSTMTVKSEKNPQMKGMIIIAGLIAILTFVSVIAVNYYQSQTATQTTYKVIAENPVTVSEAIVTQAVAEKKPDEVKKYAFKIAEDAHLSLNGPYSVVIYSANVRSYAEIVLQEALKNGHHAEILHFTDDAGKSYWRVGLGRFRTYRNAYDAGSDLPEKWSGSFFVTSVS